MHTPFFRRLFNGIAILAVLMNTLAPSLSQARAAQLGSDSGWTEVCSNLGSRWVKLDELGRVVAESTSRPDDAPASLHQGACGYCLTHAGSFALLPPTTTWQPAPPVHAAQRVRAPGLRQPAQAWLWAMPAVRAPPAQS